MRRRAVRLSGKRLLVLLIGLMAVGLGSGDGSSANLPGRDWTKYLSESGGGGFTSETLITPANAAQLRQPAGWPRQLGPSATQPLVANNLVYSGSFDGHEYAVPAVGSGAAGWSTYLGMTNGSCGGAGGIDSTGAITSVTLPGQTSPTSVLFVGGGGNDETGGGQARLYALDALTGAVIWQTPLGPAPATFIWGSPAVYTYVSAGVPTTFGVCRRLLVRRLPPRPGSGRPTGRSDRTDRAPLQRRPGRLRRRQRLGLSDDRRDRRVAVRGDGKPRHVQHGRAFTEAVIKLSAADLSPIDAWRVPRSEQVFDSDFGSTPTVFDGTIAPGGSMRPLVGVANKNGTFYVFDRGSLAPGPVARLQIADPGSDPEDGDGSIAPSAYVAGGSTTIGGTTYEGSVRAWDPNDLSKPIWEHGFADGPVLGAVTAAPWDSSRSAQALSRTS